MLNLIPKSYKMNKIRTKTLRALVGVLSVMVIITVILYFYKANQAIALDSQKSMLITYNNLKNNLSKSEENLQQVNSQIAELQELNQKIDNVNKLTYSINSFPMYKIMYDVANECPIDLNFYNISGSNTEIIIKGIAKESQSIGAFLINLKDKDWIDLVHISSTQELLRENGYSYYAYEIVIITK